MKYPLYRKTGHSTLVTDAFGGYCHRPRIGAGEFYDMENLTADDFPVLSSRKPRGICASPTAASGIAAKKTLCYTDGRYVVIGNNEPIDMELTPGDKQLVSMGAYLLIFPDRKYINTEKLLDRGSIDSHFSTLDAYAGVLYPTTFSLCDAEGHDITPTYPASDTEPSGTVSDGDTWVDKSGAKSVLKRYSGSAGAWITCPGVCVRISAFCLGDEFRPGDGIRIRITEYRDQTGRYKRPGEESYFDCPQLSDFNGTFTVKARQPDWILVNGIVDETVSVENVIDFDRKMPAFDFVTESGNRLWCCRYGEDNEGNTVNEIYASKLGDFKNWNVFSGLSTDSYAASCGTDGEWTGAVTYLGTPIFFKEDRLHRVSGTEPSVFRVTAEECAGVKKGSAGSIAAVCGTLFYLSPGGVCAYDGSSPVLLPDVFGNLSLRDGVGGACRAKYLLSAADREGNGHFFVYDTEKRYWMREDGLRAAAFASDGDETWVLDRADGRIKTLSGAGTPEAEEVSWMARTGLIGLHTADRKYLTALSVTLSLSPGAEAAVSVRYDSEGDWIPAASASGTGKTAVTMNLPVRPRRCGHFELMLTGRGAVRLFSVTKRLEEGREAGV